MLIPPLIAQQHIEARIGPVRLKQLCDLIGWGKAPAAVVADIIQAASRKAVNLMMPGFKEDEAVKILETDEWYQTQIAWIAIGLAAQGRPEFVVAQGRFRFADACKEAKKEIEDLGRKRDRSASEEANGTPNRLAAPRVNKRRFRPRKFVFSDTKDTNGSGGF